MKSIKQTVRNFRKPQEQSEESSSQNDDRISESSQPNQSENVQQSEIVQQSTSQSQSQLCSSDYVLSEKVFDPEVGYDTGNYKMQKIKFRRWNLQKRQFEYLIKWRGYSEKQCTWQTTQDILGEPCLKLQDLNKKTMLPNFQRTHAKTFIYDQVQNKNIKEYLQTRKNHLKYASPEFIDQMDQELQALYGKSHLRKIQQQKKIKEQSKGNSSLKIQHEAQILKPGNQSRKLTQSKEDINGYRVKNVKIEKLIYFPLQFELKILIRPDSDPQAKKLLTCNQLMKIDPQTGIFCYKTKLAMIEKWKKQRLLKKPI